MNDYAVEQGKPWIYSAAVGAYAVTMNILPGETACLACIFPEPPTGTVETCDTAGILNSAVNLCGFARRDRGDQVCDRRARPAAANAVLLRPVDERLVSGVFGATREPAARCARDGISGTCAARGGHILRSAGETRYRFTSMDGQWTSPELEARLRPHGQVRYNDMLLRFERGEQTLTVFRDGDRAIIQGTTDVAVARTLYARYIGS